MIILLIAKATLREKRCTPNTIVAKATLGEKNNILLIATATLGDLSNSKVCWLRFIVLIVNLRLFSEPTIIL